MRDTLDLLIGERKNCRVKYYGEEVAEVLVCNRDIFAAGTESAGEKKGKSNKCSIRTEPRPEDKERACRRARRRLFDLAACNDFAFFGTFTLDPAKIDRYDYKAVIKKVNTWLDNRVRRKGLAYVLVPEHHKDGAIHFHGLVNDCLKLVNSGKKTKGYDGEKPVFNCPEWGFGFTAFIPISGDKQRMSAYVAKYITKEGEKVGGRYYLSGGALKNPGYTYAHVDFDTFEGTVEYSVENTGIKIKRR